MRTRRIVPLTLAVSLGLGACSTPEPGPVAPVPATSVAAGSTLLAPAVPPRGLYFEQLSRRGGFHDDAQLVVYGEPRADAAAGRLLLAVYLPGSDSAVGIRPEDVDDSWIIWERPGDTDSEGDYFAVTGRELSRDELEAARDAAVFDAKRGLLQIGRDGVPDGLEPIGELPVRVGERTFLDGIGTSLIWSDRRRGAELRLTLVDADVRLIAGLVRGKPTTLRGAHGVAGVPLGREGEGEAVYVWPEGDTVAVVHTRGVDPSVAEAFIRSLRPADTKTVDALRATIPHYPPERYLDPGDASARVVGSGHSELAMWLVWLEGPVKQGLYRTGAVALHVRDGEVGGASGGDFTVSSVTRGSFVNWSSASATGVLATGAVSPDAATVRVTLTDSTTADVPVQHTSDPKLGWFGGWIAFKKPGKQQKPIRSIVVLDAAGKVLARKPPR